MEAGVWDGIKRRRLTVEAGYREQLREAVAKAKEKFHLTSLGAATRARLA